MMQQNGQIAVHTVVRLSLRATAIRCRDLWPTVVLCVP